MARLSPFFDWSWLGRKPQSSRQHNQHQHHHIEVHASITSNKDYSLLTQRSDVASSGTKNNEITLQQPYHEEVSFGWRAKVSTTSVPYQLRWNKNYSYYYQGFRHMNSWSLGADFEQSYEELQNPIKMLINQELFKGVRAYFNEDYVTDILLPDENGHLTTIQQSGNIESIEETTHQQCYFIAQNTDYVVDIEYPDFQVPDYSKDDIDDDFILEKAKESLISSFASRIASERLNNNPALDIKQDSLVTKSLLDLTSYEVTNEVRFRQTDDSFEVNDSDNPISFDDLGKIYKSISRSRILSNVGSNQCSNVHFHAHPDGSTTIHQHKSCPNPSLATLDPRRKNSNESSKAGKVSLHRGKDNSYEVVSDLVLSEIEDEVYSSLNDDSQPKRSPQSVLGPLPVPPQALPQNLNCECSKQESVSCDIEGGIKFNPCYNSKHDLTGDLCEVMLDAVWRAGHAAAVHAGRAKCLQCTQFSAKLNEDLGDLLNNNPNQPRGSNNKKQGQNHRYDKWDTLERGPPPPMFGGFYGPPHPVAMPPYGPIQMLGGPTKRPNLMMDRNIKLLAYISVVVLTILLLVIVVIVLAVFFQNHDM